MPPRDPEVPASDTGRAIVVIGGSAGSHSALLSLLGGLPGNLPAPVLVVVHTGEHANSNLPTLLTRAGPLPAEHARHQQPLVAGRVLVGPPGAHLRILDSVAEVGYGPRVNRARPSIDVLFSSAAATAGHAVVAVVLSGTLDDGAVGSALVAQAGGTVIVQDPDEARFPSMPRAVLQAVPSAAAAPAAELYSLVLDAVHRVIDARTAAPYTVPWSATMNMSDSDNPAYLAEHETRLTRLTCPDCGGGLAEVELSSIAYFRCHVGHQYAPESLLAAQTDAVERKLFSAVAALEEYALTLRYHAERIGDSARESSGELQRDADESAKLAKHISENMPGTLAQPSQPTQPERSAATYRPPLP